MQNNTILEIMVTTDNDPVKLHLFDTPYEPSSPLDAKMTLKSVKTWQQEKGFSFHALIQQNYTFFGLEFTYEGWGEDFGTYKSGINCRILKLDLEILRMQFRSQMTVFDPVPQLQAISRAKR